MTYEVKSLNEECGVFGIWGHPQAAQVTYFGLHSLQHRGQEGAGIVSNDNGKLYGYRNVGLLSEVFKNQSELDNLTGNAAIGHVRYATAGSADIRNIQPFLYKFHDGQFALCHNGNLTNAISLRKELEKQGAIFNASSDTEILMHLIRRSHNPSFMGKVKEALSTVKGGFAYLLMTEDKLIAALDPNAFRPLSIGQMQNGAWVISSETCAFEVVGAKWVRDVEPGEVISMIVVFNVIDILMKRNWQFVRWNMSILQGRIQLYMVLMFIRLEKIWESVLHKNLNRMLIL